MGSEQFNGWESLYNDESKKIYYHHLKTGTTQWQTPKNWIKHINDSDSSVYYEGPDGATTRTQPVKTIKKYSGKLLTKEEFDQLVIPPGWKKYSQVYKYKDNRLKVYFKKPGQEETTFDLEIWKAGDAPAATAAVAVAAAATLKPAELPTPAVAAAATLKPAELPTPAVAAVAQKPINFSGKLLTKERFDQLVIPPGWKKYSQVYKDNLLKVYFKKPGQTETTWILEPVAAAAAAVPTIVSGAAAGSTIVSGAAAGSKPSGAAAAASSSNALKRLQAISRKKQAKKPAQSKQEPPADRRFRLEFLGKVPDPLPPVPAPGTTIRVNDWRAIDPLILSYCTDNGIVLSAEKTVNNGPQITKQSVMALPEEQATSINGWQPLLTVGDGTCMIHALLQAISPTYRKSGDRKGEIGRWFRREVFANEFYTNPAETNLTVKKLEYAQKMYVESTNSQDYLEDIHINRFAHAYKLNIYALLQRENAYALMQFPPSFQHNLGQEKTTENQPLVNHVYAEDYDIVALLSLSEIHFETIRVKPGADLVLPYGTFMGYFPLLNKDIRLEREIKKPAAKEVIRYLLSKNVFKINADGQLDIETNSNEEKLLNRIRSKYNDEITTPENYINILASLDGWNDLIGEREDAAEIIGRLQADYSAFLTALNEKISEIDAAAAVAMVPVVAGAPLAPAAQPKVDVVAQIGDLLKDLPPLPGSIENLRRKYNEEVAAYVKLSGIERIQQEYAKYLEIPEGEKKTVENQNKCHKINFYFIHLINNIYINIYKTIIEPYSSHLRVAKKFKIYDDTIINKQKQQLEFFRNAAVGTFQLSKVQGGDPCAGTFNINNDFHKLYDIFITQIVPELNKAIGAYNKYMTKIILQPIKDDTVDKIIKDAHDKAANSLFSASMPELPKSKGGLRRFAAHSASQNLRRRTRKRRS